MGEIFKWDFPENVSSKIWKQTNDIYITIPDKEITGFITFDPFDRAIDQRKRIGDLDLDMRLYSPEVLYVLLKMLLGKKVVKLLGKNPEFFIISRFLIDPHFVFVEPRLSSWFMFRSKFHLIVSAMTKDLIELEEEAFPGNEIKIDYVELFQKGMDVKGLSDPTDMVTESIGQISKIASSIDPLTGATVKISNKTLAKTMPGIVSKIKNKFVWD